MGKRKVGGNFELPVFFPPSVGFFTGRWNFKVRGKKKSSVGILECRFVFSPSVGFFEVQWEKES